MPRPKKAKKIEEGEELSLLGEVKANSPKEDVDIDKMPLETLGDHVRYNTRARAANKRLNICRYKIIPCPEEIHPKQRVVFNRRDQPRNPLQVYISNEMIDFKKTLVPGQTYDLPLCIIDYLASKGNPIWEWVEKPDGSRETQKRSMDPRFALRTIYSA